MPTRAEILGPLNRQDCLALADALGERPQTTIDIHRLRWGLCRAFVSGPISSSLGLLLQSDALPTEPVALGTDAKVIWQLLKKIDGWECVNVAAEVAEPLRLLMQAELKVPARLYRDCYFQLLKPAASYTHPAVRQLTINDLDLVEAAPPLMHGAGYPDTATLLREGLMVGALVDGQLVSIAHTSARTSRFADVGVATLEAHRGKGLATAAASLVSQLIQRVGQIPVWSAGAANVESLRIARKLGFEPVTDRFYVIPSPRA
ncbi:MAG: GNAT family N-acetyltransferase [Phycisphaeraceae bacterium]|nr:GNAT family N-acetyltransferase [Phycisphaeraceae bacterium]